jgi:carbon-monoxide dehydrogenase small subunit
MDIDFVTIRLTVNETPRRLAVEPRRLLSDMLRDDLGLTGANVGCEHGSCGACTVLVDGQSVRSCLIFAVQANDRAVMTVEGLAQNGAMHPLQEAFWEQQGLQCGFCTPGFLMSAYEFLQQNPDPQRRRDPPRTFRQYLSLYWLSAYRRCRPRRRREDGRNRNSSC